MENIEKLININAMWSDFGAISVRNGAADGGCTSSLLHCIFCGGAKGMPFARAINLHRKAGAAAAA